MKRKVFYYITRPAGFGDYLRRYIEAQVIFKGLAKPAWNYKYEGKRAHFSTNEEYLDFVESFIRLTGFGKDFPLVDEMPNKEIIDITEDMSKFDTEPTADISAYFEDLIRARCTNRDVNYILHVHVMDKKIPNPDRAALHRDWMLNTPELFKKPSRPPKDIMFRKGKKYKVLLIVRKGDTARVNLGHIGHPNKWFSLLNYQGQTGHVTEARYNPASNRQDHKMATFHDALARHIDPKDCDVVIASDGYRLIKERCIAAWRRLVDAGYDCTKEQMYHMINLAEKEWRSNIKKYFPGARLEIDTPMSNVLRAMKEADYIVPTKSSSLTCFISIMSDSVKVIDGLVYLERREFKKNYIE